MPRHPAKIIALSILAGALGLGHASARADDWDGYGWDGRRAHDGRCPRSGWESSGWDRGGWDDGGAVRGAASQPGYGGCYVVQQPIRDGWGNIVDYRRVEVCE